MSETQIILIVAALAVIAFFFWRSLREERRMRESRKSPLKADAVRQKDVLAETVPATRTEPEMKTEIDDLPEESSRSDDAVETVQDQPSEVPPVYEDIGRKKMAEISGDLEESGFQARRVQGVKEPAVDRGIQWILDITPYEGKCFPFGAVDSLVRQVNELSLTLPVNLWGKSKDDGLYYPLYPDNRLVGDAVHLIATLVLANRASVLDEVTASSFLQILDQTAAQNDVDVRTSCDMKEALKTASQISRFIAYYDKLLEVSIVPGPQTELTLEDVKKVAEAAGFTSASARWEYRIDPMATEPVMTLEQSGEGLTSLRLVFDAPMASPARGDLKRFFQLANHLANHLGGVWLDCAGNRIEALGALMLQDEVETRAKQMTASGVRPGSDRARLLFSRSACSRATA